MRKWHQAASRVIKNQFNGNLHEMETSRIWLGNAGCSLESSILDPILPLSKSPYTLDQDLSHVDPFLIVHDEIDAVNDNILKILGSDHPVLSQVASYFFQQVGGKKVRPTMILLMAQATSASTLTVAPCQQSLAEITEMTHSDVIARRCHR